MKFSKLPMFGKEWALHAVFWIIVMGTGILVSILLPYKDLIKEQWFYFVLGFLAVALLVGFLASKFMTTPEVVEDGSDKDWRLMGQEIDLQGVTLRWAKYIRYSETWDHDHCQFCGREFSEVPIKGAVNEGYVTEIDQWICKKCFEDFKVRFQWKVV